MSEKSKTLYIEGLQKSYGGRRVVDGVSFHVQRGEVVGLLGRNGAGKTTSFDMVLGLVKPEKGTIRMEKNELSKLPIHVRSRFGIAYLPQENSTFRKLSVNDNMRLIMEMRGIPRKEQDRRSKELLEQFGLSHLEHVQAVQLSGGERRRLELARCLATNPEFILLDEPFTGVDPISISDIQGLIRRLRDEWNLGVLLTDHNPRATLKITDRAYLIDHGKILVAGSSQEWQTAKSRANTISVRTSHYEHRAQAPRSLYCKRILATAIVRYRYRHGCMVRRRPVEDHFQLDHAVRCAMEHGVHDSRSALAGNYRSHDPHRGIVRNVARIQQTLRRL